MIDVAIYERKTFRVMGIQVTHDNMLEVAQWCGGVIKITKETDGQDKKFIDLLVPRKDREKFYAWEGNWITRLVDGMSFRVYKEAEFKYAFRQLLPLGETNLAEILKEALTDPFVHVRNQMVYDWVVMAIRENGGTPDQKMCRKISNEIVRLFY